MAKKTKKNLRRKFIIESVTALFIALTPFVIYFYKYLPSDTEELVVLGITIKNGDYSSVAMLIYFVASKFIPLILLIIWFVTCRHWWYHAILIPISMYAFQLYSSLADYKRVDENEILYITIISMIIIPVVYFIRIKLIDKHVHGIDLNAMDTELQILKEKEELRKEREKLEQRKETLDKNL
jgi:hypothetical protein